MLISVTTTHQSRGVAPRALSEPYIRLLVACLVLACWAPTAVTHAQDPQGPQDLDESEGAEGFDSRRGQAPGLGRAASDIFFSENWFTFSGYGEIAINTAFDEPRDRSSEDLELYYDTLIRVAPFLGFRLLPRVFWITELGLEFLQGAGEIDFNFFPETYFDIIGRTEISFRLGLQPLFLGYINNNEEPVLYQSVNRPEVERLIIPSEWVEIGVGAYGAAHDFTYALMVTHGPELAEAQSSTWIRGGAEVRFENYGIGLNAQVAYLGIPFTELVLSGYWSYTGAGRTIDTGSGPKSFWTNMGMASLHTRVDYEGLTFMALGTVGFIEDTVGVFALTGQEHGTGQVLGDFVYGAYVELAYDIAHTWAQQFRSVVDRPTSPFRIGEVALPVFVRYERLDTHASVDEALAGEAYLSNDLHVLVVGMNYRPNHVVAFKVDGRFRKNLSAPAGSPSFESLLEVGVGLEF